MGTVLLAKTLKATIYGRHSTPPSETPDVTIVQRWSPVPRWAEGGHIFIQAHDIVRQEYKNHWGREIVCVSEYQKKGFVAAGFPESSIKVIRPILDDYSHLRAVKKRPGRWLYPTATNKGLQATLEKWVHFPVPEGRLIVTTSGYDAPEPGLCERYGAFYQPCQSPAWLAAQIAQSEGIFYVNTAPECYPMTIAIARYLGLKMRLECRGHESCGIAEALEGHDLSAAAIKSQWEALF
jgi:hypothetical protein